LEGAGALRFHAILPMNHLKALRVAIVSDTHGLLRPEAKVFAAACDYIIHGGDVGSQAILEQLSALAP
jgi:hypothetical protein